MYFLKKMLIFVILYICIFTYIYIKHINTKPFINQKPIAMKKKLCFKLTALLLILLSFSYPAKSQLADGTTAPDFTLTDINGTSHNLYTYLNAGKTVVIDFFAVW